MFWLDPCLLDVPLNSRFPSLFKLEVVKTCSIRDRLEGEGLWLWGHDPFSEILKELNGWRSPRLSVRWFFLVDRTVRNGLVMGRRLQRCGCEKVNHLEQRFQQPICDGMV
ncbi:hypothetical protein HanIR_Chr09g0400091 [Helianthus annuus]|nr:hypothetical protein HanIR_Chr09g0400091 [Helianthus annuus]